jgi:hypothetical protein
MKLDNHIVKKALLTPSDFTIEILEAMKGSKIVEADIDNDRYNDVIYTMSLKSNKTYYITKSVINKLELLDTKKCMAIEGWKLFKGLPDFKKTYILPEMPIVYSKYGGSGFVRVSKVGDLIFFIHVSSKFLPPEQRTRTIDANMYTVILYIDMREDGEGMCSHWNSADGKGLAPFLYSLMCFVELCDNEVVVVEPNHKYGTRKQDKIINILPFPITIINNSWNVTKVLKGTIWVIGHAQIYWTGPGRTIPKLLYKEPFTKEGYTRKSGKELHVA